MSVPYSYFSETFDLPHTFNFQDYEHAILALVSEFI